MVFTNSFKDAVEEGNVRKIRIMLKDSLLVDPTFSEFHEMERAAALKVRGLYDEHDGKEFEENEDRWNDEYMNKLMVQVVGNFSHERVDHLKDVVRKLRPVTNGKANSAIKDSHHNYSKSSYQKPQQSDKASRDCSKGRIAAGVVIGGIAGGALGAAVMVIPPLVTCAIGGMALGGVTAYCTSERK